MLDKRRDKYMILLTNYLIECKLEIRCPLDSPQTQDLVRVTIVHVDARRDVLSVDLRWHKLFSFKRSSH
ncbi:MAG: hypothetical protein R2860_07075 [Desulfobacterales bacterium]